MVSIASASCDSSRFISKTVFLSRAAIEQEKEVLNLISGIENFDATKLKHTETHEKNVLPTKEIIEKEKETA